MLYMWRWRAKGLGCLGMVYETMPGKMPICAFFNPVGKGKSGCNFYN